MGPSATQFSGPDKQIRFDSTPDDISLNLYLVALGKFEFTGAGGALNIRKRAFTKGSMHDSSKTLVTAWTDTESAGM